MRGHDHHDDHDNRDDDKHHIDDHNDCEFTVRTRVLTVKWGSSDPPWATGAPCSNDKAHEQLFTGTARLADGGLTEGIAKPLHHRALPNWQLKKKEGSHELETIRRRR